MCHQGVSQRHNSIELKVADGGETAIVMLEMVQSMDK